MKTSIIISFYERLGHLESCLKALQYQTQYFHEVIISDDGSREETVSKLEEMIRKYDFKITHIWSPKENFRLSKIRNNGIRASEGEYLIFLDCDITPLPDAIRLHNEAAQQKRFVAAFCKYLNREQTEYVLNGNLNDSIAILQGYYNRLPEKPIIREHRSFMKHVLLRRLRLGSARKQKCAAGHFSIFRKDIEMVNGFDENFVGWGGEDEDLFLRLSMAGMYGKSVILQARGLHLWHPHELGGKHWKEGSNIEYLYRKNIEIFCANGLQKNNAA